MTTLNNRLKLALLNRHNSKNILEKGFTLVELMIVIVIVGVLSSVALPSFLNQRARAEATEAVQQIGLLLKEAEIQNLESVEVDTIVTNLTAMLPTDDSTKWNYAVDNSTLDGFICVSAVGNGTGSATTSQYITGSLELGTRQPSVTSTIGTTNIAADEAACATAVGEGV